MAAKPMRRRADFARSLRFYRNLIVLAFVLGLSLWFIVINRQAVTVTFPFGFGRITSAAGVMILLSGMVGSVVGALAMTVFLAVRHYRSGGAEVDVAPVREELAEDRPPADYAAKTGEGFSDADWAAR